MEITWTAEAEKSLTDIIESYCKIFQVIHTF